MSTSEKRVVISAGPEELAASVAERLLDRLGKWTRAGRIVHVALSGGGIVGDVLAQAGSHPRRAQIDWSLVHIWWADERFLDSGDGERNDNLARRTILAGLDVPTANVHPVPASDQAHDIDAAAASYASDLADFGSGDAPWPAFDICLLGVGPDGHIASLFPDRPEIRVTDEATAVVRDSPKPPAERITVTRPVLNASARVWMVLVGPDKSSALGLALAGASYHSVPAAGAKGRRRTILFTDTATAAGVPPELIDDDY